MNVWVNLRSQSGQRAGVPKLTLDFDMKHDSDTSIRTVNVTAEVYVAKSVNHVAADPFLGHAILESDGCQIGPGQQATWTLGLALSPYHIQKIEDFRSGGDIYLVARFNCLTAQLEKTDPSQCKGFFHADVYCQGYGSGYCPFRVAESDWMKILKELGYGDYFMIEVPLRGVAERKQMEKATGHLLKAWEHYEEGNDRETLASSFSAFETLAKQAKCATPDQNAFEKLLGGLDDRETKDRAKLLMHHICKFLQLGRHVQGHASGSVERKDAEFGLIISQAAFAYIAKSNSRDSSPLASRQI